MSRVLLALMTLAATAVSSVDAQSTPRDQRWDPNYEPPRTADGQPDLQGNWTNATLTPFQRPDGREPLYSWDEVRGLEQPDEECPPSPGTVACGRSQAQGQSNEARLSGNTTSSGGNRPSERSTSIMAAMQAIAPMAMLIAGSRLGRTGFRVGVSSSGHRRHNSP